MGKLTSVDAENGEETYKTLIEICEKFNPDDVYCLIMKV